MFQSVVANAPVLSKVVGAGESLATASTFEGFVASVYRLMVTIKVVWTMEAAGAKSANEVLAKIFSQQWLLTFWVDFIVVFGVLVRGATAMVFSFEGSFLVDEGLMRIG